jgi:hypothetical protein
MVARMNVEIAEQRILVLTKRFRPGGAAKAP